MPNIKSAVKRVRTNETSRVNNLTFKSAMRTSLKTFETKVASKDIDGAKEAFQVATKKVDKAARKGLIHNNKAARVKSRLTKKLQELTA